MDEAVRGGARFALMLVGVALLLPGACSLLFSPLAVPLLIGDLTRWNTGPNEFDGLGFIWLAGLAAGAFGIWLLIRSAPAKDRR